METTEQSVERVLAHYGVKGMKWGVRRSEAELARARAQSPGSKAVSNARAAAKDPTRGISSLSNNELREAVERLNLEQQYARLTAQPSTLQKGQKAANQVLGVGNTANQAINFAKSPAGVALRKAMVGI